MISKENIKYYYPLSPLQEGMLFHYLMHEQTTANIHQLSYTVSGKLEIELFHKSWNLIVQRHDMLRTNFIHKKVNKAIQMVWKQREIEFVSKDLRQLDERAQTEFINDFKAKDKKRGFELHSDSLLRIAVLRVHDDKSIVIWTYHHMILDGWCMGIIMGELIQFYDSLCKGIEPETKEALSYGQYIRFLSKIPPSSSRLFWKNYLLAYESVPALSRKSNPGQNYVYAACKSIVEADKLNQLTQLAEQNNVTLNSVIQTIWGVLLGKYNTNGDAVFGYTVSGRNPEIEGVEEIVGLFINTIPVRITFDAQQTIGELLQKTHREAIDAQHFHHSSLAEIQAHTAAGPALIDHVVVFENFPINEKMEEDSKGVIEIAGVEIFEHTNYDLAVTFIPGAQLQIRIEFNELVYDKMLIQKLSAHFEQVVSEIIKNPQIKVSDINLLTETEKENLLVAYNQTDTAYPKEQSLVQLFEKQVVLLPDNIALQFGNEKLTYSELNQQANRLSKHLQSLGVEPQTAVALLLNRSFEMFIAILGVLKAGATYVPIDPDYPQERIEFILSDSASKLIIDEPFLESFLTPVRPLADGTGVSNTYDAENTGVYVDSSTPAYIIYTSGSTGIPKGTVIKHSSVSRVVLDTNYIDVTADDVALQLSNYAFDGSVFDIFGALLNGARLQLIEKEHLLNLSTLTSLISSEKISVMFITTALFNTLVDEGLNSLSGLRKILFGGERVSVPHVRKALDKLGSDVLIHVYGPTESTVFATYYPIQSLAEDAVTVPIGKPLANTKAYILDKNTRLQAQGIPGELYLSGEGLALGYLNNPELTAQVFIDNPFETGEKLYKTGDLVSMLPDGNIVFLGRVDQQVKIRGFRIELGEIESRLLQQESIKEAVVVDLKDAGGSAYLCAYIVASETVNQSLILEKLSESLPDYMVPAQLVQLDQLPLNQNGKVDRKRLPAPTFEGTMQQEYLAAQNESQQLLLEIWQDVLGLDSIGIRDNFFQLGGHSLKAMILTARIHQTMGVNLPISDVFTHPTIEALDKKLQKAETSSFQSIPKAPELEYYPLSAAQKRMYFLYEFEEESTTYNIPIALKVAGKIDPKRLEEAVSSLIERHESLRTTFLLLDGIAQQYIQNEVVFQLEKLDEKQDNKSIIENFIRPFNLTQAPLLRAGLASFSENEHLLIFDVHHIVADGASMAVLVADFIAFYEGKTKEPLNIQYKDFAVWQQDFFESDNAKKQEAYWLKQLDGELAPLNLPYDFKRPQIQTFDGNTFGFSINSDLTKQIRSFTAKNECTLFMFLLSAYTVLLAKNSNSEDLLVGTPIAGRTHSDLEKIPGIFVNTLALRSQPTNTKNFSTFLSEIKQSTLEAFENQDFPFDQLVDKLDLPRDLSRNPVFDVLFVLQNNEKGSLQTEGLQFSVSPFQNQIAKFDLSLHAAELDQEIALSFEYATHLFLPETISRFSETFIRIIQQIVANPSQKIGDLEVLSEQEKHQLLVDFNQSDATYPKEETMLSLFEKQVLTMPDNVAVVFEDKSLTYAELNALSNQLAHFILDNCAVQADDKIAILLDRSEWILVSILAVLKTGGCYVPIDPTYPQERIDFMLSDSAAKLVVDEAYISRFLADSSLYSTEKTGVSRNPHHLAYIIYTSGSTGQPKGVMIEDQQVVRLLFNDKNRFDFSSSDVWTLFHSYCFDFSVWEMYGALLYGGKLIVVPKLVAQSTPDFRNLVQEHGVTVLNQTPGAFYNFIPEELALDQALLSLRYVIFGGEALSPAKLGDFQTKYPDTKLINMYGITETTVHVTYKEITQVEIEAGISNIGVPIPTLQVYVLSPNQQLLPIGVAGELCVGGAGLARGYLNREELTAEKFVSNPFKSGEKLYRSGDLARFLPNGELEYLGRIDQQVKIRGFRIELGEIEAKMLSLGHFKDVVVIDKKDSDSSSFLVAYFTSGQSLSTGDLASLLPSAVRQELSSLLPDYMLPSYFVQLENIPLTSNGKVDRKALPEPKSLALSGENYAPPRNETEAVLCEVWQKTLGIDAIGIHDDFFSSGGDSIKAIQIASRLRASGLKLEIKNLFRYSTIALLSPHVKNAIVIADQGNISGLLPLTPVQHWFVEQRFSVAQHWNQSLMFFFDGKLDDQLVKQAVLALLQHHDALRMRLENQSQAFIAPWSKEYDVELAVFDFSDLEDAAEAIHSQAQQLQAGLSLDETLLKVALFHTKQGDHLLFAVHHFITDGVSWRILIEDLGTAYNQLESGQKVSLLSKTHSYLHWAQKLSAYAQSNKAKKELNFWKNTAAQQVAKLPKKSDTRKSYAGSEVITLSLDPEQTNLLLKKANLAYHTSIDDLLLTALALSVKQWTGAQQTLIHLEGHGREDLFSDLDITRTVGWFTSIYPVLLNLPDEDNFSLQIRSIKENLRNIPNKGVGYGILKYLSDESTNAILDCKADISFNYLGQFDQDVQKESKWGISRLSIGDSVHQMNERVAALDFTGMIANGKLSFNINFHPDDFDKTQIDEFIANYSTNLHAIITHCASIEETVSTPSDFSLAQLSIAELENIKLTYSDKGKIQDLYPLTPMQEGMLYHSLSSSNGAYFEQAAFNFKGKLNLDFFSESMQQTINRHDILRTVFVHEAISRPHQLVFENQEVDFVFEDLRNLSETEQNASLLNIKENDRNRSFDLAHDRLMRMILIQLNDDKFEVIWSHHHILMDGWCIALIIKDFFGYYAHLSEQKTFEPEPVFAYRDYLAWLGVQDQNQAADYWKSYLHGYEQAVSLPSAKEKTTVFKLEHLELKFDVQTMSKLQNAAAEHKITVNSFIQTAWGILLQTYNNCDDVVFGSVVSGRPPQIAGVENIIGLFINTIPVRVQSKNEKTFAELALEVQQHAIESGSFDYFPLAEIQSFTPLKRDLIQHIMVFENFPVSEGVEQEKSEGEFEITKFEMREQTNYDLTLVVIPGRDLTLKMEFNAAVHSQESISAICKHFELIMLQLIENPSINLNEVKLLSDSEKHQLLVDFNQSDAAFPKEETILSLFEKQVETGPDNVAVVFEDKSLSYAELNALSNQLAHFILDNCAVQADDKIAILLDRSEWILVSILAVLKTGGCYVPIDPGYPQERIDFMRSDSAAKLVVDEAYISRFLADSSLYSTEKTGISRNPHDLAYIIYTSGSTGQPKGVMIEDRQVVRLLFNDKNRFNFSSSDVWTLFHSYCFDFSVWEMYGALLYGGKLIVVPKLVAQSTPDFRNLVQEYGVTVLNQTPGAFYNFIPEDLAQDEALLSLRYVIFGGEALSPAKLGDFHAKYPDTKLINMYGITETTVHVTYKEITRVEIEAGISNIGVPIPTLQVYVLNTALQLVPIGVAGELCVSGAGLARGYLNRGELTAEKFVSNPFKSGEKLYRSGDLARFLPNGELEYLGRIDQQVKIRGFRIELGEIEAKMLSLGVFDDVVVIDKKDHTGASYLCAYFKRSESESESEKSFTEQLAKVLPDYMIPSFFVQLDHIPLTSNGKVDRKALPEPDGSLSSSTVYLAPSNETEQKLAEIWQEVLGIEKVGVKDNFFELGGHSLKMIRLMAEMKKSFGRNLTIEQLLTQQTIQKQAGMLQPNANLSDNLSSVINLLSPKREKNLFFFPPMSAHGISYQELAQQLESHSVYAFNFTEEANYLELFAEQIKQVQPEGPYIFVGYSIGGNLAHHLAHFMNRDSLTVSDVILLDSTFREKVRPMTADEIELNATDFISRTDQNTLQLLETANLMDDVTKKVRAYVDFVFHTMDKIESKQRVHLIKSSFDSEAAQRSLECWKNEAKNQFHLYAGFGNHSEMLAQTHLEKNADVLKQILTQIDLLQADVFSFPSSFENE